MMDVLGSFCLRKKKGRKDSNGVWISNNVHRQKELVDYCIIGTLWLEATAANYLAFGARRCSAEKR